MRPSNTYHKTDNLFIGALQPILDSLKSTPCLPGRLVGEDIVINNRAGVNIIIALDTASNIHLLISPASENDPRFAKINLKGLQISDVIWSISGRPEQTYLDVSCSTGILPTFQRPFLRFAEDVLLDLSQSDAKPADAVYTTCTRWKKFWSPDSETEVNKDWARGLLGELILLDDLIERFGPTVVKSWTGPLGMDQDFQNGNILAVEVKTSTETPFKINCNIHQLDSKLFNFLYLVCYRFSSAENGIALPDLVRRIESHVKINEQELENFYEKLATTGYKLQLENFYNTVRVDYNDAIVYKIDDSFPKIVERSFIAAPDHRISGIRYTLQISGVDELTIDSISTHLKQLA